MKVSSNKNTKKPLKIIIAAVIVLLAGLGAVLIVNYNQNNNNITPADNKSAEETKNDLDTKENLIGDPDSQDAVDTPKANNDSVTITNSQTTTSVTIFVKLLNVPAGSCELRITNGSKEYTSTAPVIYQPEFSSCAGFTVAKSNLNGPGAWNLTLNIINDQINLTKSTTIEVK